MNGFSVEKRVFDAERVRELAKGAVLGLAVGDALGVPAEFMEMSELKEKPLTGMTGGGAHGQSPGTWSDDTSMTLCTMDSLTEKGIDYDDQMQRFADWLWNASNTARDEVFDVGGTTKFAIFKFVKKTPALDCGETQDYCCGNGSLMRIIPTALYLFGQNGKSELDDSMAEVIHYTSKCTHAHPRCQMACGVYCGVMFRMCHGGDLREAVMEGVRSALAYYRTKEEFSDVYAEFESLREIGDWREEQVCGSGFVLHTLQASLWCLLTTESYRECVLQAVNLGLDTDTTAAVAGALAGLWYGEKSIPKEWAEVTAKYGEIRERCVNFAAACLKKM